jgi:hypothetical protein
MLSLPRTPPLVTVTRPAVASGVVIVPLNVGFAVGAAPRFVSAPEAVEEPVPPDVTETVLVPDIAVPVAL